MGKERRGIKKEGVRMEGRDKKKFRKEKEKKKKEEEIWVLERRPGQEILQMKPVLHTL